MLGWRKRGRQETARGAEWSLVSFPDLIAVGKGVDHVIVSAQIGAQGAKMVGRARGALRMLQSGRPIDESHGAAIQGIQNVLDLLGPRVVGGGKKWHLGRIPQIQRKIKSRQP